MAGLCRVGLCMTGLCMAAGLAAGLAGPATAQGIDPPTPAPSATGIATGPGGGKWRGQITPYVWATGLGGSIRPAGTDRGVRIDTSFTDLLRDLDGALFVSGLARRDRLVLLGDLSWSSSSRAGVLPVPPAGLPARARLRQTSATLAGGWRAIEGPGTTVDLLAGARLWRVRGAVSSALGAAASTHSFVDPLVAARVNLRIAPQWSALVHVDVGGFGAGSHRATQVLGTVNHRTDSGITVSAGYRHLEVDYRRGGSRFDLRMGGPILGATWQF
ncbi:hypothetical protein CCR87_09060 [Rhodobaculum claviforme]|uniref:Outer membrane protein beta-barrel domain-containing protein n=2 Tax=Rhodobaculum claviforme TaxID=1549854 RepID=A0A934TKF8_9RHOB|nr:hypothetical protein [Rhodobaculum claviforme]